MDAAAVTILDKPQASDETEDPSALAQIDDTLQQMGAEQRVEWTLENLPGQQVLTSSFGIQAAVMLHMVTRVRRDIPVILLDTGYLFPETYRFVDQLTERLKLNLHVYRSRLSSRWQESRYGQLWEQGLPGLAHYNRLNKIEPLERAFGELQVGTWFAGLRREQADSRNALPVVRIQHGRYKVHPIVDWRSRDIHRYLVRHQLPYHPLREQGYVSVGDTHTSRAIQPGMRAEDTRFFGLKRECGIHE